MSKIDFNNNKVSCSLLFNNFFNKMNYYFIQLVHFTQFLAQIMQLIKL